eukprot:scaffold42557_cov21-Tisochrysis_lutea.AAC.2
MPSMTTADITVRSAVSMGAGMACSLCKSQDTEGPLRSMSGIGWKVHCETGKGIGIGAWLACKRDAGGFRLLGGLIGDPWGCFQAGLGLNCQASAAKSARSGGGKTTAMCCPSSMLLQQHLEVGWDGSCVCGSSKG